MTNDLVHSSPLSHQLLIGVRAAVVFLVLCGLLYTGIATLLGGLLFPHQATGSLIEKDGKRIGSELVAQPFGSPGYFYSRPSAADYDPTATGGSNLAPSNPALRERVADDSARIQEAEAVSASAIPVDLVAASGAGLDPHITPEAAQLQAARVASARKLPESAVFGAIGSATEGRQWGLFGQPRVNVLKLNLLLDTLSPDNGTAAQPKTEEESQ